MHFTHVSLRIRVQVSYHFVYVRCSSETITQGGRLGTRGETVVPGVASVSTVTLSALMNEFEGYHSREPLPMSLFTSLWT